MLRVTRVLPLLKPSDAVTSDIPFSGPPVSQLSDLVATITEAASSDTMIHDSGFIAKFSDDDVDAEVFAFGCFRLARSMSLHDAGIRRRSRPGQFNR